MAPSTKEQIAERAETVSSALAEAKESLDLETPDKIQVADRTLNALSCDEDNLRSADSQVRSLLHGPDGEESIGRGMEYWNKRPGVIKFTAFPSLAAAYQSTGEEKYARAARVFIEDMWACKERPGGVMHTSSRISRWARFMPYFFDSPEFDADFVDRMVESINDQLEFVLENQKIQSRGNIRLLQTNGIFWAAICLPMLDLADKCLNRAQWVYQDMARRDIEDDGSHVEHDPNYHEIYQSTFYNLMIWKKAFPEAELPDVGETAARVFDYAVSTRRPNGHCCGIQESSSAWVGGEDMTPFLRKRSQVRRLAGLPEKDPPKFAHCADAGQVFMRDGWDRDAEYVVFDASRWGGAHSHLARNSVQLFRDGRALLVDTGTLTYAMDQKAREGDEFDNRIGPYGKSTPAHNTLNLNGWNQVPTNPDYLRSFEDESFCAVVSQYSGGYWPGSYGWWFREGYGAGVHAEHLRILIWVKNRATVVIDRMLRGDDSRYGGEEQQNPSLEMNWQLTPGGNVELLPDNQGFTAIYPEANLLGHFATLADKMDVSVKEGETDPFRGWITTRLKARSDLRRAGVFDEPPLSEWEDRTYGPAPQICCTADPMKGYAESMISVFVPYQGQEPPQLSTQVSGSIDSAFPENTSGSLRLQWGDGSSDTLVWTGALTQPLFKYRQGNHLFETDGVILHILRDTEGSLSGMGALDATYMNMSR
ncbi:MAG: heparinase II/III family protein [Candidatus Brocadiia bacterium]